MPSWIRKGEGANSAEMFARDADPVQIARR
jgi:hypothetical protein